MTLLFARAREDVFELSSIEPVQFYFLVESFVYDENDDRTALSASQALDAAIVLFRELIAGGSYRAVKYSFNEQTRQVAPAIIDRCEPIDQLEKIIRAAYLDPSADVNDFGFQMALAYNESDLERRRRYAEIIAKASP